MNPARTPALAPVLLAAVLLAGCQIVPEIPRSQGGDLTLTGRQILARAKTVFESDDRPTLPFRFDHAWYACEGKQTATFVLVQGGEENPTATAVVNVLWRPTAGSTPIDENASNATLRIVRHLPDAAETWAGAGFVFLEDEPKHRMMNAQCWNADMARQAATDGAPATADSLGPAKAEGRFTAEYAPEKVAEMLKKIEAKEREKLPAK